jgi:hypothetical protein
VDGTDRERARADTVELITGLDHGAVGDAVPDRVQDDRHVLDGKAVHGQLRSLLTEPEPDRVCPGRRDLVAEDSGDRPADAADVISDSFHAGLRIEA